jgi:hypothetical protein
MKTMMNSRISTVYKHTLRALRAVVLIAALASGEAGAIDSPFPGYFGYAASGVWTQVASACTPDEDSLNYQLSDAAFASTTGEVTVRCNVTDLIKEGYWNTFEVTYRDPDGSAADNRVLVELHRYSSVGELISTSINGQPITLKQYDFTLTSINSNDSTVTARTTVSKLFYHNFDFVNNAYYVLIKVKRPTTGSGTNPTAFVVRLYQSLSIGG